MKGGNGESFGGESQVALGGMLQQQQLSSGTHLFRWSILLFVIAIGIMCFALWMLLYKSKGHSARLGRASTESQPITIVVTDSGSAGRHDDGIRRTPLNAHTRGEADSYSQIGLLTAEKNNEDDPFIMPLFGRRLYNRSNRWEYYAGADKIHVYKIPVYVKDKNCTEETGCEEIYEGDSVTVPTYPNKTFRATLYKVDSLRYIPY